MARLSYAATLRAREICRLSRQLLNLHQTAKLAFTVAPLVRITIHLYSCIFFYFSTTVLESIYLTSPQQLSSA